MDAYHLTKSDDHWHPIKKCATRASIVGTTQETLQTAHNFFENRRRILENSQREWGIQENEHILAQSILVNVRVNRLRQLLQIVLGDSNEISSIFTHR